MAYFIARGWVARLGVLLALGASSPAALAQQPTDPYNYTRTSAFTFQANGLLASETSEPDLAQLCANTTYTYDTWGNRTGATTGNCAGASALALIDSRSSSATYASLPNVTVGGVTFNVPAGTFATNAANALNHTESRVYDPRFGVMTALTGPNQLNTNWTLDNFGRVTRESRADGTKTTTFYCWLSTSPNGLAINTSSNSAECHNGNAPNAALVPTPLAGEFRADAVRYEHSVTLGADNTQTGVFVRVYFDRAGRQIRTVTQAFDGTSQTGGANRLIVQDTDYNAYGAMLLSTQPYFLDSASSTTTGSANYGMTMSEYDALGRTITTYSTDPTTTQQSGGSTASIAFGSRGTRQAARSTVAYTGLTILSTDDKGRTRKEEQNLQGRVVRVTDGSGSTADAGAQIVYQYAAFGQLAVTKDALQNTIRITYDISGRRVVLNDPDAGVIAYCFDALGQLKAQQNSKQRGSHAYTYSTASCPNVAGNGTTAPAAAGWTTFAYDVLGRTTNRAEPEYASTWSYDQADPVACAKAKGKLCQTSTSHGVARKLVYDALGRPLNSRTDITSGPSMATAIGYDTNSGRVTSQTYPTGVKVSYLYTARGYMRAAQLDTQATISPLPATPGGTPAAGTTLAAGTLLWQRGVVDAWGNSEQHSYANGINNRAVFDAQSGRLTNLTAGTGNTSAVVDQRYTWNSVDLMTQRIDAIGDASGVQVSDSYEYDKLGRLTKYTVAGGSAGNPVSRSVNLTYNALGMLLSKSDVGDYTYPTQGAANGKSHAVQSIAGAYAVGYTYDLNGNAVTATNGKWRAMSYTSFNLPDGSTGIEGPLGSPRSTWQYDESHQRIKEVRVDGSGTRTSWYLHPDNRGGLAFEREVAANGAQSNRHYIGVGGFAQAVLVTTGALPTLSAGQTAPAPLTTTASVKLEYWHKDHLGSIVATTDHAGSVTGRFAYDPLGKRRYANATYDAFGDLKVDWTTDTNNGNDRGFTGHEHLDSLGLVHMNGRLYDPMIGRFMQADPLISRPYNLQDFDRYSYCFNNPITCTDPSGFDEGGAGDSGGTGGYNGGGQTTDAEGNTLGTTGTVDRSDPGGGRGGDGASPGIATTMTVRNATVVDGQLSFAPNVPFVLEITAKGRNAPGAVGFAGSGGDGNDKAEEAARNEDRRNRIDPTRNPMARAAGVGLASLAAVLWGNLTDNQGLANAGFDGARDLGLSNMDGVSMAIGLGLGGRTGGRGGTKGTPAGMTNRGVPEAAVPPETIVCRGGQCRASNFEPGTGVTPGPGGTLNGVSTQSRPGTTKSSLSVVAQPFPNGQVGVTTVGAIKDAGGRVNFDGTPGNPNHATVTGLTAQQLETLFTPTVPNPVPKGDRGLR